MAVTVNAIAHCPQHCLTQQALQGVPLQAWSAAAGGERGSGFRLGKVDALVAVQETGVLRMAR